MAVKQTVTSDQYYVIEGKMLEIKRQLRLKGGTLLDPERLKGELQEIVENRPKIHINEYPPIVVDYSMSLTGMVEVGRYDEVKIPLFEDCRFAEGEGKIRYRPYLVSFDRPIGFELILRKMEKNGIRPANVEELLAFGAQYPEKQNDHLRIICALGTIIDDYVMCLDGNISGNRWLCLRSFYDGVWNNDRDDEWLFLAVREML